MLDWSRDLRSDRELPALSKTWKNNKHVVLLANTLCFHLHVNYLIHGLLSRCVFVPMWTIACSLIAPPAYANSDRVFPSWMLISEREREELCVMLDAAYVCREVGGLWNQCAAPLAGSDLRWGGDTLFWLRQRWRGNAKAELVGCEFEDRRQMAVVVQLSSSAYFFVKLSAVLWLLTRHKAVINVLCFFKPWFTMPVDSAVVFPKVQSIE